jgi:hypothetical protein
MMAQLYTRIPRVIPTRVEDSLLASSHLHPESNQASSLRQIDVWRAVVVPGPPSVVVPGPVPSGRPFTVRMEGHAGRHRRGGRAVLPWQNVHREGGTVTPLPATKEFPTPVGITVMARCSSGTCALPRQLTRDLLLCRHAPAGIICTQCVQSMPSHGESL